MTVFEPYFDWPDLTACVPAGMTSAELNALGAEQQAHFPLWLDPAQSLGDLFLHSRFTSRSFRYGGLGDNVLGLRWVLPNGHKVDLGGRVVKNVAGFDLVRFFCASGGRFGRPENLVLRLRPKAAAERVATAQGGWDALERFVKAVRGSSWAHALEAMDLNGGAVHLLYANHAALLAPFEDAAQLWARAAGVQLGFSNDLPAQAAKPWARAQTTLASMLDEAKAWNGAVSGFLGQGLLQLEPGTEAELLALHGRIGMEGGHVEHASILPDPQAPNAAWERAFLEKLSRL
jgi:FAD/FMN-containing dehydrogenase